MARLSVGHVLTGAALGTAGGAALLAGLTRAPALPASVLFVDGPTFAVVVGGVLLAGGGLLLAFSVKRDEEPAPSVPAHVAFASRPQAQRIEPPAPAARPRVAPKVPPALGHLDLQIKQVTREINKAGVMLATGKLSREGYVQYVEDLKRQRGDLEAARLSLEMRRHEG
jgi:hypothetical protein